MKTLLKNGRIVDVYTDTLVRENALIEDGKIIGIGEYTEDEADIVQDVTGKILCPGFIDGHIHIESTMLKPVEFAKACLPHGTTTVIADPHEIANVAGLSGIEYMLEASEGIPMTICYTMPSCVPATPLDEAGAVIGAEDIDHFYSHPRVIGLGEVMNYPGVIAGDSDLLEKIRKTRERNMIINGHAPMLSGKGLDRYICAGIVDDHECSGLQEALERIHKGQWIMIRQGTAARNLEGLLGLFDEPFSRRCLIVTDDKHPADILESGHIDSVIRQAVALGKSPLTGIRMATLQAAMRFGLTTKGAIAPGMDADILVLSDLDSVSVEDVYCRGEKVVDHAQVMQIQDRPIREDIRESVCNSFSMPLIQKESFYIAPEENHCDASDASVASAFMAAGDAGSHGSLCRKCRVIRLIPNQLLTDEVHLDIDFSKNNGVDLERDILKLAVMERHHNTGHVGLGFVQGMGLKSGAVASSVSHDSHNLIVVGTSDEDMAAAANCVKDMGGGLVVVDHGQVTASMPLPIGGLMGNGSASEIAAQNANVRKEAKKLGTSRDIEPFMHLAFVSLPVIPNLKMTTHGLVDVNTQSLLPLFIS